MLSYRIIFMKLCMYKYHVLNVSIKLYCIVIVSLNIIDPTFYFERTKVGSFWSSFSDIGMSSLSSNKLRVPHLTRFNPIPWDVQCTSTCRHVPPTASGIKIIIINKHVLNYRCITWNYSKFWEEEKSAHLISLHLMLNLFKKGNA